MLAFAEEWKCPCEVAGVVWGSACCLGVAACSLEFVVTEIHTRYETDIMPMLSRFIFKSLIFLENSADYLLTCLMKMLALLGSYFLFPPCVPFYFVRCFSNTSSILWLFAISAFQSSALPIPVSFLFNFWSLFRFPRCICFPQGPCHWIGGLRWRGVVCCGRCLC